MNDTFLMASTSSITVQCLGKIVQRAPAVGAKMWCLSLCFCLSRSQSGAPCVRGVHSSNTHCVAVYRPISTTFTAFFPNDCSFRRAKQFSHWLLVGATIVAKLRSKIAKSPKIGGKVCAHHFIQIDGFEKKFYCNSLGPRLQMCTYIKIFRQSLPSADSMYQSS